MQSYLTSTVVQGHVSVCRSELPGKIGKRQVRFTRGLNPSLFSCIQGVIGGHPAPGQRVNSTCLYVVESGQIAQLIRSVGHGFDISLRRAVRPVRYLGEHPRET